MLTVSYKVSIREYADAGIIKKKHIQSKTFQYMSTEKYVQRQSVY